MKLYRMSIYKTYMLVYINRTLVQKQTIKIVNKIY